MPTYFGDRRIGRCFPPAKPPINGANTLDAVTRRLEEVERRFEEAERQIAEIRNQEPATPYKYYVMTQAEYDALKTHEPNVPYFIVEPRLWRFGDNLPIILGGYGTALGEPFPIILN